VIASTKKKTNKKKSSKKKVSLQESSSDDSDHYIIEDAFMIDAEDNWCAECDSFSHEEVARTDNTDSGNDWEVEDTFFDEWIEDFYTIESMDTSDGYEDSDSSVGDCYMADNDESIKVISEDEASWYNSDFDTVSSGRLTDDQLNETATRVVRVLEPPLQEDPLVFELNTVERFYEEGPHDEELPGFEGMNEYHPYQKEE
jgi:hypothetical protein